LTPITSPRLLTSGPPELPGFRAASVWMMLSISRPVLDRNDRAVADHAGRHCVLEPVRVADGDDQLADLDFPRVAEVDAAQVWGGDVQHGQVGLRVLADQLGRVAPAVGQGDADHVGPVDDVAVGQDQPVGGEDEPRPATAGRSLRASVAAAAGGAGVGLVADLNVHHGRARPLGRVDDGL